MNFSIYMMLPDARQFFPELAKSNFEEILRESVRARPKKRPSPEKQSSKNGRQLEKMTHHTPVTSFPPSSSFTSHRSD